MSQSFSSLGLSEALVSNLITLEINTPTEIQEKAIPVILNSTDDVVGLAQTGTGKTAAFLLPLLDLVDTSVLNIQTVILAPTRELGQQIFANIESLTTNTPNISTALVCGGTSIKDQVDRLSSTTHIIVATPGRLIDLIQRQKIDISKVKYFVLDEADEMILTLKEGLDKIVAVMPKSKRTLLFSATLPGSIKQLIQNYMSKHVSQVNATTVNLTNQSIQHQYVIVEPIEKLDVLLHFLTSKEGEQGIIFCKTKAAVNKLAKNLAIHKISSGAIHGSLTQGIRDRIMEQFRNGFIKTLVATDVAARGIDIPAISYVVNYHLPDAVETYIHRSGRTARAGATGLSMSILQADEVEKMEFLKQEYELEVEEYKKPTALSIEENNTVLWAKKVFKTKPNNQISQELKSKVKTVFHHLTKEELVDKVLANYLLENKATDVLIKDKPVKKRNKKH